SVRGIALDCQQLFPHKDSLVNRELAILLAEFARTRELEASQVVANLLAALLDAKDDRAQQIHYFYCLRLIHAGWTVPEKEALLKWYEETRTWTGGASFTRFLENILGDLRPVFTPAESSDVIARARLMPQSALAFLRFTGPENLPTPIRLRELYAATSNSLQP